MTHNRDDEMAYAAIKKGILRILDKYLSGKAMDYRMVIAILIPLLVDQAFIVILSLTLIHI